MTDLQADSVFLDTQVVITAMADWTFKTIHRKQVFVNLAVSLTAEQMQFIKY